MRNGADNANNHYAQKLDEQMQELKEAIDRIGADEFSTDFRDRYDEMRRWAAETVLMLSIAGE